MVCPVKPLMNVIEIQRWVEKERLTHSQRKNVSHTAKLQRYCTSDISTWTEILPVYVDFLLVLFADFVGNMVSVGEVGLMMPP